MYITSNVFRLSAISCCFWHVLKKKRERIAELNMWGAEGPFNLNSSDQFAFVALQFLLELSA